MLIQLLLACTPAPGPAGIPVDSGLTGSTTDTGEACEAPGGVEGFDAWGGDLRVTEEATGFFGTVKLCGRWWLLTPEGHPFWSLGVNSITPEGDYEASTGTYPYGDAVDALYADDTEWATAELARLQGWGFNTAGAWSREEVLSAAMPVAPVLYLSGSDWLSGEVDDWFDPAWEEGALTAATEQIAGKEEDPQVLGWFLDNEIRWGPDWRGIATLLQLYLAKAADAPGKAVAVDLVLAQTGGVEAANALLGTSFADRAAMLDATEGWDALASGKSDAEAALTTAFLEQAAEQYFSLATAAVRQVDPNHLLLGNREVATLTRVEVWRAAARHLDVLSINHYTLAPGIGEAAMIVSGGLDPADFFALLHAEADLPVLVGEFGFRAADSGLPNDWPPIYPVYDTQTERTEAAMAWLDGAWAAPWVVGAHWFKWQDQPPGGRFDGEDNNWGLVDLTDQPWPEVTGAFAERAGAWRALVQVPVGG